MLNKVCRSLEAAGFSVLAVVALEATPGLAVNGHVARRARRCLEATGLSVVADLAGDVGAPGPRPYGKANLALFREETGSRGPGGQGAVEGRAQAGPVIVLTTAQDEEAARAAFARGRLGYIVKEGGAAPASGPSAPATSVREAPAVGLGVGPGLTGRELEVLGALATGASTVEVARQLYVSPKTVKNHIAHIYAKLGASSRTQAVAKALRQGIVSID
jgi:DNA-binding NarL/FixJ family response regulator